MSALTSGTKKITYDILGKIINYEGGGALIHNLFKRYISESSPQILRGFIKFSTGIYI